MIAGNVIAPISKASPREALLARFGRIPSMDEILAAGWFITLDAYDKLIKGGATMGNAVSDKKNARCFSLKLSRNTDKDIIEHLEQQQNIQAYLKRLIREDMKRTQG